MRAISSVLICDGTSDAMLLPIIKNALTALAPSLRFQETLLPSFSGHDLEKRFADVLAYYPCELIFIHRDAEGQGISARVNEISSATKLRRTHELQHIVAVIPIKMTEAWLLLDEHAIRTAVGNPNGRMPLNLPSLKKIESCDAKARLYEALETAKPHVLSKRRSFRPQEYCIRVSEAFDQSHQKLMQLPSYLHFVNDLSLALKKIGEKL